MHSSGKFGFIVFVTIALPILFLMQACKHEIPKPNNPNGDGGDGTGIPCDPNIVYFEQQILPFLISSCAKSGCHNAASAQNGVVLTSYTSVMNTADVKPYNLSGSDLWEVITDNDPDDKMPPPGENPLTPEQINLIGQWINQGAQNLKCDDDLGPCDSVAVSFSGSIQPILQNKCVGCHTTATSLNGMINLTNHQGVVAATASGRLLGAINHTPPFTPMPNGGQKLNSCEIAKITNWIYEGSLNN